MSATEAISSSPAQAESGEQSVAPLMPEAAAITVIVVWGSTFTLTKSLYNEMAPLAFGGLRFIAIVAIAFLVLWSGARRAGEPGRLRIRRADIPLYILTGLLGYTGYQLGFMLGLEHTSPFAGALMIASSTPLVSLLIVTAMGEKQPPAIWFGALLAVIGVTIFLFSGSEGMTWLGNAIAFGGGVSFAFYQVLNRRLIREYAAPTYSAWSTLFGAIPLILIGAPAMLSQDWDGVSGVSWLSFLYMCIFPVYLAYIAWGWAIKNGGVAITGLALLVPVVAGVLSWLLYDEDFTVRKLLGGSLAVAGLVWMQWANRRRMKTPAQVQAA